MLVSVVQHNDSTFVYIMKWSPWCLVSLCHHNIFLVLVKKTFRIYSLSNFHVCGALSFTVDTMLCVLCLLSSWFIYFITGSLYLWPPSPILPASSPLPPWQPLIWFFFLWAYFVFLDSTFMEDHMVFVFLYLIYFTKHKALKFYPCCCKWQGFIIFSGWIIFHCSELLF